MRDALPLTRDADHWSGTWNHQYRVALYQIAERRPQVSRYTDWEIQSMVKEAREVVSRRSGTPIAQHQNKPSAPKKGSYIPMVREWLEHPEVWSPFPDEIALERAMRFDWDVIHSLSRTEMSVFLERLAGMDDPFEAELHQIELSGHWSFGNPRLEGWYRGTEGDRKLVRDRVSSFRYWRRKRAGSVSL